MALTPEREGQIARAFLKQSMVEEGFYMDQNFRRHVGNMAKQTGVPFDEALEFQTKLLNEVLSVVTDPNKVTDEEKQGLDHRGHPYRHGGGH